MKEKKQRGEPHIEALLQYANNIIATLREPFLVLDKNLQVISTNQAYYDTFKIVDKDTIGRQLPDLGNKQWNIPKLLLFLKEILPEKKVIKDYEVEHKFEQIGERVMRLNACQLRVPKKIAGIITAGVREEELILLAIEDITERKRLLVELKESEGRYRRAFETSRDGLLLVHKIEGNILNSNAAAQESLGYSHEKLLKKKLWDMGIVEDLKDFQEVAARLEIDGVIHFERVFVKTSECSSVDAEVYLTDKAKVIQCNIRGITERKKTEKEIAFQAQIIQNMPTIVAYHDKDLSMIWANNAYQKATGLSLEEIKGKKCYHVWNLSKSCRGCPVLTAIETGEKATCELTPDNQDHWPETQGAWLCEATPIRDEHGAVIGAVEFAINITERKKAEVEMANRLAELETYYKASVNREERILELKKEVEELKKELGK